MAVKPADSDPVTAEGQDNVFLILLLIIINHSHYNQLSVYTSRTQCGASFSWTFSFYFCQAAQLHQSLCLLLYTCYV